MGDIGKLVDLVGRLRGPGGCPWDREQELADLRAYLLEEAHEAAAALDDVVASGGAPADGDACGSGGTKAERAWRELGDELGDLLFQAAFVIRLGEEAGHLERRRVVDGVHAKMVARHPHVFPPAGGVADGEGEEEGETEELEDAAAVSRAWERRKLEQRKLAGGEATSLLAGVPTSLPALLAAYRLTQKAAGVGFDWPDAATVLAKVDEELAELKAEVDAGNTEGSGEEVGDLLFTVANLARKLGHDPEAALAAANAKFRRRFAAVEAGLKERGRPLAEAELEEMDALWEASKRQE